MSLKHIHNQPTSLDIRISSAVERVVCNPLYFGAWDKHIKRFKNY